MIILRQLYQDKNLNDTFVMVYFIGIFVTTMTHYLNVLLNGPELALKTKDKTSFSIFLRYLVVNGSIISAVTVLVTYQEPWTPYFLHPATGLTPDSPTLPFLMP